MPSGLRRLVEINVSPVEPRPVPCQTVVSNLRSKCGGGGPKRTFMFELPWSTTLLVFGFPVFWILYTIGFLIVTRGWRLEEPDRKDFEDGT